MLVVPVTLCVHKPLAVQLNVRVPLVQLPAPVQVQVAPDREHPVLEVHAVPLTLVKATLVIGLKLQLQLVDEVQPQVSVTSIGTMPLVFDPEEIWLFSIDPKGAAYGK